MSKEQTGRPEDRKTGRPEDRKIGRSEDRKTGRPKDRGRGMLLRRQKRETEGAFAELERDGLVFSQRTSGRFVTEDEEALRQIRRSLSEEIINELCTRLTHLGMDREEIRAAVDAWASGNFLSAESEKETKPERELSPENEIKPKES